MPMGLINSPETYMRMINFKLKGLIGKICFAYVDDLIVFGSTKEEHMQNLKTVFQRLRKTNLKLNPDKCSFFQRELEYLGHKVSPNGITQFERNVEKVLNFSQPKNRKEVERFIGLASYYRKFIPKFSKLTHNMNKLNSKNVEFAFNEKCIEEFNTLRKMLSSYPLIHHPDTSKPFILHTDSSNEGLGASLSQLDENGNERTCSYISVFIYIWVTEPR